jgi:hypothetical protein
MLGYRLWQNFEKSIEIGIDNLESAIGDTTQHLISSNKLPTASNPVPLQDYKLSRIACYHIALACDSRGKPNVKAAKHYFAIKTREAEVAIPALSEKLLLAQLDNQNLRMQLELQSRQDNRISMYGLPTTLLLEGKADAIVEVDRPTIEVIDVQSGAKFSGQTTKQLAEYLNKNGGRNFKSGAELERELNKLGRADLVDTVPRKTLQPFVSKENLSEACRILTNNRQQRLLGE